MKAKISYEELSIIVKKKTGVQVNLEQGQSSNCVIVRLTNVQLPVCVKIVSVDNNQITAVCRLEQQNLGGLLGNIVGKIFNVGIGTVLQRIPRFTGFSVIDDNTVKIDLNQIDKLSQVLTFADLESVSFDSSGCVVTAFLK